MDRQLIILDEDSENSRLSKLLKAYADFQGVNIQFVDGAGKLKKAAEKLKDTHFCIIFMDVVEDNPNTTKTFARLQKYIKRGLINGIVVPRSGIEWVYIKAFCDFPIWEVVDLNYALMGTRAWRNYVEDPKVSSYEECGKWLLDNNTMTCSKRTEDPLVAVFYFDNCLCDLCSDNCTPITFLEKSEALWKVIDLMDINTCPIDHMIELNNKFVEDFNKYREQLKSEKYCRSPEIGCHLNEWSLKLPSNNKGKNAEFLDFQ